MIFIFGQHVRAILAAGVAVAAAAIAEMASSAAIVTLAFTVGTWALDFIAAGRGGWLQQLASYTPASALRFFEQGLLRLNTVIVMIAVAVAGFAEAAIWSHTGRRFSARLLSVVPVVLVLALVMIAATRVRASWDLSENRRNSFSHADETVLRQIQPPLHITVFLAPEDPRLTDFEQNVLKKLRRVLPTLSVQYSAGSQTGLFEGNADHYGEIWYEMNGQKVMERSTIEQVVLEQIYKLGNVTAPQSSEPDYPGYPLATQPKLAAAIFYLLWPLIIGAGWWLVRR